MSVYIVSNARVMLAEVVQAGAERSIVLYRDLDGRPHTVVRANRFVFATAREAGEALDAEAKALDL